MRSSSKKSIPVLAYVRSRLNTEHAKRARAAEKDLDASKHIPTSNPEPTNIPDRQTIADESKVTRAEGYSIVLMKKKLKRGKKNVRAVFKHLINILSRNNKKRLKNILKNLSKKLSRATVLLSLLRMAPNISDCPFILYIFDRASCNTVN